jgi:hypothetical protein
MIEFEAQLFLPGIPPCGKFDLDFLLQLDFGFENA